MISLPDDVISQINERLEQISNEDNAVKIIECWISRETYLFYFCIFRTCRRSITIFSFEVSRTLNWNELVDRVIQKIVEYIELKPIFKEINVFDNISKIL